MGSFILRTKKICRDFLSLEHQNSSEPWAGRGRMGLSSARSSRAPDLSLFDTSTRRVETFKYWFCHVRGGSKEKADGFVVWQNCD